MDSQVYIIYLILLFQIYLVAVVNHFIVLPKLKESKYYNLYIVFVTVIVLIITFVILKRFLF